MRADITFEYRFRIEAGSVKEWRAADKVSTKIVEVFASGEDS